MRRASARTVETGQMRGVFIFTLMALFTVLSLVIVLLGARVYRSITAVCEEAQCSRTTISYIAGKVRASDEAGMVSVEHAQSGDVLRLGQTLNGKRYDTFLYCDRGNIMEYFTVGGSVFDTSYGEPVTAAADLTLSLENGLLSVAVLDNDGHTHAMRLSLSARGEANP